MSEEECERCKDWQRMGLSNTCPTCDLLELARKEVEKEKKKRFEDLVEREKFHRKLKF